MLRFHRSLFVVAVVFSFAAAAAPARAQDPFAGDASAPPPSGGSRATASAGFAPTATAASGFGTTGQWVLTLNTLDGGGYLFLHKTSGGGSEVNIHPAIDTFIVSSLSVGGVVGIHYVSGGGGTYLDFGARAGYDIGIAPQISIWPLAAVIVHHQNVDHGSNTSSSLDLYAPFLWHPVAHAFAGLGPSVVLGLSGGSSQQFGVDFVLGGWL